MIQSLIAAFSMYSKIPMPHIEWNEKSMKYSMCCFPLIGVVIGLLSLGSCYALSFLRGGAILRASVLTVLPIMVTGGIHMDGFLDTIDAKSSYKSKEERLKILKDPHTGAFAIIYGMVYVLLSFGLFSEITNRQIGLVAMGYVYSRILSGLSVVTFRKARHNGMVAVMADAAEKHVKWLLAAELIICMAGMLVIGGISNAVRGIIRAAFCLMAGWLVFFYYRHMAYQCFGGITGDLAGYFLQICELMILLAAVL